MATASKKSAKASPNGAKRVSAEQMSKKQREISVSEFFTKNRHLLGFDSPRKGLLTCVKEAVDNALDASEEAGILPEVHVILEVAHEGPNKPRVSEAKRFRVTVIDYGPGIVRQQIPRIFAKLLYGSKFHRLRMSRGQQGIGISAAGMYGQLTTGKPVKIISRTGENKPAHYFEVQIDTKKNEPRILEGKSIKWENHQGTQVTIELEGRYTKGRASVDEYLAQTAIANPHVKIVYETPEGEKILYERTHHELPAQPKEIKPHPYGIEFGMMLKMLHDTKSHWLSGFLQADFSRISSTLADEISKNAGLKPRAKPRDIHGADAERLYKTLQETKIMAPPTNCISPIGEKAILYGLYQQIKGDFYTAVTRPPAVYRGNPFIIECGLAFGKGPEAAAKEAAKEVMPLAEGESKKGDVEFARVIRYANRVPLLYQQSACATFKAVMETTWRNYGITQSRGALPHGPMVIFVHMASVWVPFTSESKEAIADYDEINHEIKLALRECGRRLGSFLKRRERAKGEMRRRDIFSLYIEEVAEACKKLKGGKLAVEKLKKQLHEIAKKRTGGEKTDKTLDKKSGPEGLPHSIIVTQEGVQGDAPVAPAEAAEAGVSEKAQAEAVHQAALEEKAAEQAELAREADPAPAKPAAKAKAAKKAAAKKPGKKKAAKKPVKKAAKKKPAPKGKKKTAKKPPKKAKKSAPKAKKK